MLLDVDKALYRDLGTYPARAFDKEPVMTKLDPQTGELYDAKENMFHNDNEAEGSRRPIDHGYRAVSGEDLAGIRSRGYMQSDARMNLEETEGTVAKAIEPPGTTCPKKARARS